MDTLVTFRTFFRNIAQNEDGLTLIEVVITALFVGLIAVGTLTGFQVLDRASADERFHDEAELLAAQSQEHLRSDPANTLDELAGQGGSLEEHKRTYTLAVDGTTYTIKQAAQYFNEAKPGSDCSGIGATESGSKEDGDYLRVTSSVTWPQLHTRKAVSESSIVTPPDGSALEIDATNGALPEGNLSGVNATIKYTGVESKEPTMLEGTTGASGCIVFGGIPATTAKVEVKELSGYVTESGSTKVPTKEVTVAPNITTHDQMVLNEGGAITAEFMYNGTPVEGNTFVAAYEGAHNPNSEYTVGAPKFEYESGGENKYKTVTTEYVKVATTPMTTSYIKGDLFPFPYSSTNLEHNKRWQVYAGDCEANNAETIDKSVTNGVTPVLPGKTTPAISVPMSYLALTVYTGKSGSTTVDKTPVPVKITDTACSASQAPNNASAANLEHKQKTNAGGHLEHVYQPFGEAKLCIEYTTTTPKTEYHTQTLAYDLTEPAEHIDSLYTEETAKKEYLTGTSKKDTVEVVNSTSKFSCP